MQRSLEDRVREVARRDGRYAPAAYLFIYEALDHTVRSLRRRGHVTGRELLEGLRRLAEDQFGGLAPMVFERWGVCKTVDFGNMVFNLVEARMMGRSHEDTLKDFANVFDIREAFRVDRTGC